MKRYFIFWRVVVFYFSGPRLSWVSPIGVAESRSVLSIKSIVLDRLHPEGSDLQHITKLDDDVRQ